MDPYNIIVNPVVTEKSTFLQEKGKYTFDVYTSASKIDISRAIESIFDVKVVSVHQILDVDNNHKIKTSKRLGFKLSHETNNK